MAPPASQAPPGARNASGGTPPPVHPRSWPLWARLAAVVALECAGRALVAALTGDGAAGDPSAPPAPHLAFWAIIGVIAGAIWTGIQAAGTATLIALQWTVTILWSFATMTYNAVKAIGAAAWDGLRETWQFFRDTYSEVIKPAWDHFWRWYDRARAWLDRVFGPIFEFLNFIRKYVLDVYAKYVRPILDIIAIARKSLQVLVSLGVDWARVLDQKLADLDARIDAPFRAVLTYVNGIVNVLNRVITFDGLLQRLALVRSIERDIREVTRALVNWKTVPLAPWEWEDLKERGARTPAEFRKAFESAVSPGAAARDPAILKLSERWRELLKAP